MKLHYILILIFVGVSLSIIASGEIVFYKSQESLEKLYLEKIELTSLHIMDQIHSEINSSVETFEVYSRDSFVISEISESNKAFAKMNNVEEYILQKDKEWRNTEQDTLTPFMENLIYSESSDNLRTVLDFYEEREGYRVYGELFITNAYGANISQTQKTSDYYQADEDWWTQARDKGIFIDSVDYDESSNVFSKDIAIRIDDDGEFAGVMKIVLNLDGIKNTLDEHVEENKKEFKTFGLRLLENDGKIVYSSNDFTMFESLPTEEYDNINMDSGSFFCDHDIQRDTIHGYSQPNKDNLDHNLILISDQKTSEIMAPINDMRTYTLIVASSFAGIAMVSGTFFSSTLTRPLYTLQNATKKIVDGSYDVKVPISGTNEIKSLIKSFNKMAKSLLNYEVALEDKLTLEIELNKQKEIDIQKKEFASMISHELKTPLTPILGHCEILADDTDSENLSVDQKHSVETINQSAKRLERLISDLLDVQKLDLGKMSFNNEKIIVTDFINKLKDDFPSIKNKKLKLINSSSSNSYVSTDPLRLEQIMNNLIENAIDFVSDKNGTIEFGAEDRDHDVLFYVKDNGVGIPKDKQKNLFKKFYQIDTSNTRSHQGTGLGLAICKGLVDTMKGKIWVESEVGKGTSVYFTIPNPTS